MKILIEATTIQERIRTLASEINADYRDQELIVLGVLKGCLVFMADLIRLLEMPLYTEFVRIQSYGDDTVSSGKPILHMDCKQSLGGCHILIVEDIIDTGLSLELLRQRISQEKPATLRICSLLVKKDKSAIAKEADYVGFFIEDRFVVGYGMDLAGKYRNLNYIAELEESEMP